MASTTVGKISISRWSNACPALRKKVSVRDGGMAAAMIPRPGPGKTTPSLAGRRPKAASALVQDREAREGQHAPVVDLEVVGAVEARRLESLAVEHVREREDAAGDDHHRGQHL